MPLFHTNALTAVDNNLTPAKVISHAVAEKDAAAQLEPSAISKEVFFGLLNFLLSTGSKVCKVCKECSIVD